LKRGRGKGKKAEARNQMEDVQKRAVVPKKIDSRGLLLQSFLKGH